MFSFFEELKAQKGLVEVLKAIKNEHVFCSINSNNVRNPSTVFYMHGITKFI